MQGDGIERTAESMAAAEIESAYHDLKIDDPPPDSPGGVTCFNRGQTSGEASPYADRLSRARAGNTARRTSGVGSPNGARSAVPSAAARNDRGDSGRSSPARLRPPPSEADIKRRLSRAGDGSDLTMLVRLMRDAETGSLGISLQYDDPNQKPPVVSACEPSAEEAGLRPGDQLLEIDGKTVDAGKQLAELLPPKTTEFQLKLRRHGPGWKALLGYPG